MDKCREKHDALISESKQRVSLQILYVRLFMRIPSGFAICVITNFSQNF